MRACHRLAGRDGDPALLLLQGARVHPSRLLRIYRVRHARRGLLPAHANPCYLLPAHSRVPFACGKARHVSSISHALTPPPRRHPRGARYDCEELNQQPPEVPLHDRIVRNILADKPRVTRYQIDWSN